MTNTPLFYDEQQREDLEEGQKLINAYEEEQNAAEQQQIEAQQRAKSLREDSHEAKEASEFGLKENLTELKNAVVGGVRDSASSILTAPERLVDMATGEMQREQQKGGYTPDWNPFGEELNPVTKTWWGGMIRGGVHFGTLAIPIVGWAGRAGKATGIVGAVARGTVGSSNFIIRGASVGAASDLVSEYSQDANGLQVLRDRYGFVDTPITTKDSDHPALKTVKNMVEGLGIGTIADGVFRAIGKARNLRGRTDNPSRNVLSAIDKIESNRVQKAEKAAKDLVDLNLRNATIKKLFAKGIDFNQLTPAEQINAMTKVQKADKAGRFSTWTPPGEDNVARAERKIEERNNSVESQRIEKAKEELKDPNVRGHKNGPIVNQWQGAPNSTGKAYDVGNTLRRIQREWGAETGSTDSLVTPAAAESLAKTGLGKKGITPAIAKELLGDARFKRVMEDLNSKGRSLQEAYGDAYERFQEVVGGRDAAALEPDEFWGPIRKQVATTGDFEYWSVDNILAADLVQESLFKQLRDRAMVAREVLAITDLTDVDGPLKYLQDNLIVGTEQVKRSQFLTSPEYAQLISQKGGKKQIAEILDQLHLDTKAQVDMMFDVARQSPSDEFLHAILEAFSMSNKITNWKDLDGYMRQRLYGRTTEAGIKETGALIRELQGVMVNSILTGPKTPLRAIMGTATATFTRPLAGSIGGIIKYTSSGFSDLSAFRTALSEANGMIQAIPESFDLFKSRLNSYWAGDISTIKNRYAEFSNADEHWELMRNWAESDRASWGERAAFRVSNVARTLNDNSFITYSTKLMSATDDAFTLILARGRSRVKAMNAALDAQAQGIIPDINSELIRDYQNRFYHEIFDPDTVTVKEDWLKHVRGEVTLTKDLTGFGKSMDQLFNHNPFLKPFYLFARTGINGLELTAKHTPVFNFLVKEFNDIAWANADDLSVVAKYGIENADDLANAKALQNGRLAIGSSIILMANQKYLNGGLTGNGPEDASQRRLWQATGWQPRSIKLGDAWVSYDSFEPFATLLAGIADLGDNQRLMGDEWVERGLLSHALIISKGIISKQYLQGMSSLVDLFGNDPKALEKIAGNIANNTIPLAGLRNELGKVFNPHMKELNSGFWSAIRNRNLLFEKLAGDDQLPTKYDLLTGQPIRNWDFFTRAYNAISPIQLNFDQSPGRRFLFRSQYNLNISVYTAPDGTSLRDNPRLRSYFQKAIGEQNLEAQLAKLALRPDVQQSIQQMERDLASGKANVPPGISPMDYPHNILIHNLFKKARNRAWASLSENSDIIHLRALEDLNRASRSKRQRGDFRGSNKQYDQATQLLEMTNK